ncbi:hypothetical protein SAMN06295981_0708 [Corynebacterium pollutisoli]|uniref:Uncharacterized protein n=1 Tax=Corynebacterium pollutisoli TaxID=1610489 RepID=A0A1X7IL15_9CORY|nr:hypothetical protein [Corynebacterium pollutisoli]NLP38496.1 hypothetical protein [Corynebacterium pollutisoli]SMG15029.1 hypothetical protein SAMN06295981_0708 [Corynebacterium pollutisoli]HJD78461.1 hypothetical protein [Corynebacterium pollutisoli]
MTTIETALGIGSLVTVCGLIVAGIATMSAHLVAVDTAGAAARAYAIGADFTPPRGDVAVSESSGLATAVASVPSPLGPRRHAAVFPVEVP